MPNCKFDHSAPGGVYRSKELEALAAITRLLSSNATQEEGLFKVGEILKALNGVEGVQIIGLGDDAGELQVLHSTRSRVMQGARHVRNVVSSGTPVLTPLQTEAPRMRIAHAGLEAEPRYLICAPIPIGQRTAGVLTVECAARPLPELEERCRMLSMVGMLIACNARMSGLFESLSTPPDARPIEAPKPFALRERVALLEYDLVMAALWQHEGVVSAAAEDLGITERMVRYKMQKLEIDHDALFKQRRAEKERGMPHENTNRDAR